MERNLNDFASDATFDDPSLGAGKQQQLDFTTDVIPEAQAAPEYQQCHTATQASAGVTACFAATRPLVAVGNVDGSVCMYDVPAAAVKGSSGAFRVNRQIQTHRGAVRDLAVHPQGRYLVSCGRDSVIAFHDLTKSSAQGPYRTIQVQPPLPRLAPSTRLCFITLPPVVNPIRGDSCLGWFKLWRISSPTGSFADSIPAHGCISDSSFSDIPCPSCPHLISVPHHQPRSALIFRSSLRLTTFQDPHGPSSLAVHPSGDYVLVGTGHCNVRIYDASTSQCFVSAYFSDQHTAPITCVDYSLDGKQYASGCKNGFIKIWDGVSSRTVFSWQDAHSGAPVSSATFSRNGMYLLTAGLDSVVRLWDLRAGGRVLCKYEGATQAKMPWRAIFSHDESIVMAPDADSGCVQLWDARLATKVAAIDKPTDRGVSSVAHSPQRGIAVTCSPDMTVAFWASTPQAAPQTPAQ